MFNSLVEKENSVSFAVNPYTIEQLKLIDQKTLDEKLPGKDGKYKGLELIKSEDIKVAPQDISIAVVNSAVKSLASLKGDYTVHADVKNTDNTPKSVINSAGVDDKIELKKASTNDRTV